MSDHQTDSSMFGVNKGKIDDENLVSLTDMKHRTHDGSPKNDSDDSQLHGIDIK